MSHFSKAADRPVLRVLLSAPVDMIGGQAHAARAIQQGFAGQVGISVCLQPINPTLPPPFRFLTETKVLRSLVRPLLYLGGLIRKTRHADVLHIFCAAHTAFLFGAFPAVVVGRLFRRGIVLNYHDGRARQHFRYWGPLLRWTLRRADCLVVPSAYLQQVFAEEGFAARVIPNVVDLDAFEYRPPVPLRQGLVSVRSLEPLYAVENTLAVFEALSREFPAITLDIYGDGVSAPSLRHAAESRGLRGVRFHGGVAHERMPAILAAGGIMVNSSRIDNMPLFVLEAYAAGLPIVSTAAGGIPFMIESGRTGLLVPPDDPAALAAAVRQLLLEPELALRLAEAGRRETARYTWEVARAGWLAAYHDAARSARRE